MRDHVPAFIWPLMLTLASTVAGQPLSSPYSERHGLQAPIERFVLSGDTFEVALRNLAAIARPNAVIGFEPVTGSDEDKRGGIKGEIKNGTVGDVLALMVAADDRYTYSEPQPGVIRVRAKVENRELAAIVNLPIMEARIEARDWPANIIIRFAEFLPELGQYLQARELAWSRRTGRPLPGSAGSIMSSNVPLPEVSVAVRNTTVRGVLDAIAAYTLEHCSKTVTDNPWVPPTGWRVNFRSDSEAWTGLGGYVSWSRFP